MFNKTLITATMLTLAVCGAQPAAAEKASKEESIGVASGAVIGAAAGGPIGFIVGAAIGAKIGDGYHNRNERIATLEREVSTSEQRVGQLNSEIEWLANEVDRLGHMAQPELLDLLQSGIDMDLLFRTDESALTEATNERLMLLATRLADMPDVRVQLDGFADERGDNDYNLALSARRVDFVREQFLAAGVGEHRISSNAHGETDSIDDTSDNYALERRVSVRLFVEPADTFASRTTNE